MSHIPDDFILDLQGLQVTFATVVVEHVLPDIVPSPHLLDLRAKREHSVSFNILLYCC